jgi:carbamate kinase
MIELLASRGVIVVCAGGGGIPVVADDAGGLRGVEAVVDKDLTAAVLDGYGTPQARPIHRVTPGELRACSFPAGSRTPRPCWTARPGRLSRQESDERISQ